ncbi:MAG: response regulator, partial [Candidatus Omnitrophica bacterium]|nr:response regulator [Candidatus Omnitrophota bacterium]
MPGNNRILFICDDNELSRYLVEKLMVEGGYFVALEPTVPKGLASFKDNGFDIVMTRAQMPGSNPLDLVRELKAADPDCVIIALLDEYKQEVLEYLFSLGVYDVISKPINLEKLFFLVKKGIDMHTLMAVNRRLTQGLKESNFALEKQNT